MLACIYFYMQSEFVLMRTRVIDNIHVWLNYSGMLCICKWIIPSGFLDQTFSNTNAYEEEYSEIEDPYQTLDTKDVQGYAMLEMDSNRGTPTSQRYNSWG